MDVDRTPIYVDGLYVDYKIMVHTYKTTTDEERLEYKQLRIHSHNLHEEPLKCQVKKSLILNADVKNNEGVEKGLQVAP